MKQLPELTFVLLLVLFSSIGCDDDFVEKEQPELNEQSKVLIAAYQKNPTYDNYMTLRSNVETNYRSVLVKKENKLAELKEETLGKKDGDKVVAEMNDIVQDMYITYWEHINDSMLRFTDPRLYGANRWTIADAYKYDYIPIMGAGTSVYIKRYPVTNGEYKAYLTATGKTIPNRLNTEDENLPINYISYNDALAYCEWMNTQDTTNSYRLPSESEWELAAGHMPKDADFNANNINPGRVSVFYYQNVTRGAHGAIDFWGNVWEWTTTKRNWTHYGVKGGSWKSSRTDCRTEHRKEGRAPDIESDDMGFRIVQLKNKIEPERKLELASLSWPEVNAVKDGNDITLSWNAITKSSEKKVFDQEIMQYQIYIYDIENKIFKMGNATSSTSFTLKNFENPDKYKFVVQAVSLVEFSDNIFEENTVAATEKKEEGNADKKNIDNGNSETKTQNDPDSSLSSANTQIINLFLYIFLLTFALC